MKYFFCCCCLMFIQVVAPKLKKKQFERSMSCKRNSLDTIRAFIVLGLAIKLPCKQLQREVMLEDNAESTE